MPPTEAPALRLGYWLSSEEHGPAALVAHAVEAERVGFEVAMISDHFHPWTRTQGQSPFVWSVLGAIAQATSGLRVGTGVTAPIIRMHPVVVAHAAATAAVQFEGRFFLGLGSGERLNEHVTGARWPAAGERREMLAEAVDVIRRLLDGGNVNHRGAFFTVENAQLFSLPEVPPPILLAVGGRRSAELAAQVADGMIGVGASARAVEAFEANGGHGKTRIAQLHLCWDRDAAVARKIAHTWWPNAVLTGGALSDLARPVDYEAALAHVDEDDVAGTMVCGPDPEPHLEAIARLAAAGYTEVHLHQVGPDQRGFLRFCADHLLPAVA